MEQRTSPWIKGLGTVLAVWAHPDDETYLSGGLLAAAVDAGQRVAVVSATRGEAGFDDPTAWPPERAARVRRYESLAAMAALGVTDHRVLGYPDGACAEVDVTEAGARLRAVVEEVRPDTVVTFGPDGMTGHPDHRAVSAWVDHAVAGLDGNRPLVLHAAREDRRAARFAWLDERFRVVVDPSVVRTVPADRLALHLHLDGPALDRKLVALRAMATQTGDLVAGLGEDVYAEWVAEEGFVVASTDRTAIGSWG